MINKGLFTSNRDDWETPQDFYDELDREFNFALDVCATPENAKYRRYITPEQDSLKQSWAEMAKGRACYMNPPYGREIGRWVKKAYEESQKGAIVVCLLPARTDTVWFHEYVQGKAEIRFIRGRLKFGKSRNSAPFPSMVVVFRP